MNLVDLLDFLYHGAFPVWQYLISHLTNHSIKTLRLIQKSASTALFPYLFHRLYISAHSTDLSVFQRIATHPLAAKHVRELLWDDCTFDRWIQGQQTYTDRLLQFTTTPTHILKREQVAITQAYRFWAAEATSFAANREDALDKLAFDKHIAAFPNLERIVILSRSRLTYVEPELYWKLWQTPRTRRWRAQPFHRHLLQPEPFKPSTGTTTSDSEGIRPIKIIRAKARNDSSFRVGHLAINSIGGGQSRASGSSMVSANRFERSFHIDLQRLTEDYTHMRRTKGVALQLFLETQTEDIFRNAGVLEDNLDLLMMDVASSLEELRISNVCLDWFMDYSTLVNTTQFPYLRTLRRVEIVGGSSDDPGPLLHFLAQMTSVREIVFKELHLETVTWVEVLETLRDNSITFDVFELQPCKGQWPIVQDLPESRVWKESIVSWLKRERDGFPLLCV
jgi:hypothetical protein